MSGPVTLFTPVSVCSLTSVATHHLRPSGSGNEVELLRYGEEELATDKVPSAVRCLDKGGEAYAHEERGHEDPGQRQP